MTNKLRTLILALSTVLAAAHLHAADPSPRLSQPETAPAKFNSDLFRVDKTIVESTEILGENARYRIRLEALGDIEQIRILETLPPGLLFIESHPAPAEAKGGSFLWTWPKMTSGATQDIIITVRPSQDGWLVTNTKVAIIPTLGLAIYSGTPRLELTKTGPAQAELGDNITFRLAVTNAGTGPARDVIVTDTLPAGLYGPDRGSNIITHKIGTLAPGQTRLIDIPAKAAVKGDWENRANAFSTQLVQANAAARVSVVESKLSLSKSGLDRAFIFGEVTYSITGRNDGDTTLRGTTLVDVIPAGTQVIRVSDGGETARTQVSWTLPDIPPGQQFTRTVTLTALAPIVAEAAATATLSTGRSVSASARTEWEGAPGVLTEITDDVDPVRVGGRVTYTVKITNQSPLRSLTSNATVRVLPTLRILEVSKNVGATIDGEYVRANDITLKPRSSLTFKITAEAVQQGVGGVRFEFGAGFLPKAVVKEEITYVY